ncbi:MAG: hypothetical protein CMP10_21690 [Zetaproteobacteria bacterium]|nr:hypothetical protein [Pseudobdellovibrionaceae bacterium]
MVGKEDREELQAEPDEAAAATHNHGPKKNVAQSAMAMVKPDVSARKPATTVSEGLTAVVVVMVQMAPRDHMVLSKSIFLKIVQPLL